MTKSQIEAAARTMESRIEEMHANAKHLRAQGFLDLAREVDDEATHLFGVHIICTESDASPSRVVHNVHCVRELGEISPVY